ncbi:MAG TPA: glutamate racemase [Bdellovibrionales bacterium]|mgnify:CR=1 FL=1|nr:glutamate racemase [Bdellovibrionales bacterium]
MPSIGVFDSGVGGLTVLRALKTHWPNENFIYLADTARLPYGNKSIGTVHNYVEQCLGFMSRHPLKAVVIACNTASAAMIEAPIEFSVPVFNVIEPGARKALEASQNKKIGVLATRATVQSEAYPHALKRLNPEVESHQLACPLFVPLVEEGWVDDPVTNLIVYRYVSNISRHGIDTLIMGCTHYPVLKANIRRAVGGGIRLIDSSPGLIEDLGQVDGIGQGDRRMSILCTDFSPRLEETAKLLLGDIAFEPIQSVDL